MFTINQNGGKYDSLPDLNVAIGLAEELLGAVPAGEQCTFTVEDEDGKVLAALSNRRITGTFVQQAWGGRKNNEAVYCGVEPPFDATDAILLMDYAELIELEDGSESSDAVGQAHVQWSGPCEVRITTSICEYFGVSAVEEITPEALAYARRRLDPQPAAETVVSLSIRVKVRVAPGACVQSFIENMDYSVVSKTAGVVVSHTEIV